MKCGLFHKIDGTLVDTWDVVLCHPETDFLYYAAFCKCVNLCSKDKSSQSNITVVHRLEISAAVCDALQVASYLFFLNYDIQFNGRLSLMCRPKQD